VTDQSSPAITLSPSFDCGALEAVNEPVTGRGPWPLWPEQRSGVWVQIRHYFYAEHWKIGTIARELGLHPDTVCAFR
jgi:hypothetical protein